MESLGVEKDQVGFYAGLTSSVFSLSQAITGVPWGRASDRFGRKAAILTGTVITMLTSILFGFSRSLTWAILARALAGACNGNVGIMRTTVAELVPQKELQPRAFSIMPLVFTIGSIFGPAYGGFFADPARRHPDVFGRNAFLLEYPYALPNLIAAVLFIIGLTSGFLFLRETQAQRKYDRDYGIVLGKKLTYPIKQCMKARKATSASRERRPLLDDSETSSSSSRATMNGSTGKPAPKSHTPIIYREVFTRQSILNLLVYGMLALHSIAFDQLLPIYLHHPRQDAWHDPHTKLPFKFASGFGINSQRIGLLFALYGICGVIVQLFIYPPVARRFGVLHCFKVCSLIFPVVYAITPFTALLQSRMSQQSAIFVLMAIKSVAVVFSFPSSTILLTNSASSMKVLGTLNGFATSISALGRAIGPSLGGGAFSWGIEIGYVIVPWWLISVMAMLAAIPIFNLVEMEGFSGDESESDDDDDEDDSEATPDVEEAAPFNRQSTVKNPLADTTHPDNEEAVEDGPPLARMKSSSSGYGRLKPPSEHRSRRMSVPIGGGAMRRSASHRYSSNIGQSNNGLGPGGTSWH
ncbi:MAG: hypothetical protein M1833_002161 [Piccolia ochrophora]|nr:MAG: hypothetical protein M1833_002161 [Piccolia ochrophora]